MNFRIHIYQIFKHWLFQHTLFWIVSFYVLLRLFAYNLEISRIDYIYTFLFHISIWLSVYINLQVLMATSLAFLGDDGSGFRVDVCDEDTEQFQRQSSFNGG